jgi:hypothetical protein
MRTTLDLDGRLLRAAKKRAAEDGTTLTRLLEQALRRYLAPPSSARAPYKLELLVKEGPVPPVDVADRDALYRWMEEQR